MKLWQEGDKENYKQELIIESNLYADAVQQGRDHIDILNEELLDLETKSVPSPRQPNNDLTPEDRCRISEIANIEIIEPELEEMGLDLDDHIYQTHIRTKILLEFP